MQMYVSIHVCVIDSFNHIYLMNVSEERCECCKSCCYSTPYSTIFALSITVVGLVGFLSSAVYSVVLIDDTPSVANQ